MEWLSSVLYNIQMNLQLPSDIHNSNECVNKHHIWGCFEDGVKPSSSC